MSDRPPRTRRGLFWAAVLTAVAVTVTGAVLAWTGLRNSAGVEGAIRSYFSALQDADAARALAFGTVPDGPRLLLTDQVLTAQQEAAPIHNVTILSVVKKGSTATASVRYTLDYPGAPQVAVDTIGLHKKGNDWRLDRAAVPTTLSLAGAAQRAGIVGAVLPKGRVLIFPGAVPITFDTPYLALDPQSSRVGFASGAVEVGVAVSVQGRKVLVKLVTDRLKDCLTHPAAASTCPLPTPMTVPGSVKGSLTGDVNRALHTTVTADPSGQIAVSGTVAFNGTYRTLDFSDQPVTRTGKDTLPLTSRAFAVKPLVVDWTAS